MLDHIGLDVSDITKSKDFYLAALKPLGYELFMVWEKWVGFSINGKPYLWLRDGTATSPGIHIAFQAKDRKTVNEFHRAAIAAGGKDNGPPGVREIYHPNYYGAFVLDPDGHNIEAVCHEPHA
ncbi:MAG TPA: VOC family protein [Gammaproteobacteria bacterium]|nr:VOC family protein [Gammaproteobacteria bacterium]